MTNRIGDRPNFPLPNQRFDKGDALNIAQYYEDIIAHYAGSVYGQAWGCVSVPQFDVVPVLLPGSSPQYYLQFNKFVLMYSVPANGTVNTTTMDNGPWRATVITHDPDKPGQVMQSLPLNTVATAQSRPWILFRRNETTTDRGNKIYWDTGSNTEDIGDADLQVSEYVEFRFSTTYQAVDRGAGWYRCAYIDSWVGTGPSADPRIVPIHWMDSQYYNDSTPPVQGTAVASALGFTAAPATYGVYGFSPDSEMPELAKLLHWVIGKLGQHYSTEGTVQVTSANQATYNLKPGAFVANYSAMVGGWLSTPPRGLVEVDAYLNEVENTYLPTLEGRINFIDQQLRLYRQTPRLLHTLYIKPVSPGVGAEWESYTFNVSLLTSTNAVNSYSPTCVTYTGSSPAASELAYRLTPTTPFGAGSLTKKLAVELVSGASFQVSSVVVSFAADESRTNTPGPDQAPKYELQYLTAAPAVMPPSAYVTASIKIDPFAVYDAMDRYAIVLHIYGRNI